MHFHSLILIHQNQKDFLAIDHSLSIMAHTLVDFHVHAETNPGQRIYVFVVVLLAASPS